MNDMKSDKRNILSDVVIKLVILILLILTLTQQIHLNKMIDELNKDEILEQVKRGGNDSLELIQLENDILNLSYSINTLYNLNSDTDNMN